MSLNSETEDKPNSIRLNMDKLRLGDYQLKSVNAQITYDESRRLCIETFECEIHNVLTCTGAFVIRLSAVNVELETRSHEVCNDHDQRSSSLHINHLRVHSVEGSPEESRVHPWHVTDCRLNIITHHYESAVYTEVLLVPDPVQQQQHGSACCLDLLEELIHKVLHIPVVVVDREHECHLRAVVRQTAKLMDNTSKSAAYEKNIARQMTSNLISEIKFLESIGKTALSASLLRRLPIIALRLLLPCSDTVSQTNEQQLVDLLLMLHRIQPDKAVTLLMTEWDVRAFDWHNALETPAIRLLFKHCLSSTIPDLQTRHQRKNDMCRLLLAWSNRQLLEECRQDSNTPGHGDHYPEMAYGLAGFFSLLQIIQPAVRTRHPDSNNDSLLKQAMEYSRAKHDRLEQPLPVILHYEQLFRLTGAPEVLSVLATFSQLGGFHFQRLEGVLFSVLVDRDLAILADSRSALSGGNTDGAIKQLLRLSRDKHLGMIAAYFRHLKGQLALKAWILDVFCQHHTQKEQRRLLLLLPESVLFRMVDHYLLETEQACIDRLLNRVDKVTVTKRQWIAAVLPIDRLQKRVIALRTQRAEGDQQTTLINELLDDAQSRLERTLDVASEFFPDTAIRLLAYDDGVLNARIKARTLSGDIAAARQFTQHLLARLLADGYRIAVDSLATSAFNHYLADLKQLYIRYRFWSYELFEQLLQGAQAADWLVGLREKKSLTQYSLHELPERGSELFQDLQLSARYCDQGMMLLNMVERLRLDAMVS